MADGTAVVEAADVEVTELKLGDHVARGQTGLAAQLLCSSCAVFHELACHQALTTQLSKAVDRERPLVAEVGRLTPAAAERRQFSLWWSGLMSGVGNAMAMIAAWPLAVVSFAGDAGQLLW